MMSSDFSREVEIRPFCTCTMHPAIIIGTVRSLWTWLWGRYHVPQNAFLVVTYFGQFYDVASDSADVETVNCVSFFIAVFCDGSVYHSVQVYDFIERCLGVKNVC